MKRKLLRQIANEWRANLWLSLELLIVSVIVWYIADYIYAFVATRMEPTGFNTEHVYKVTFGTISSQNPRYIDYGEDEKVQNENNLRNLAKALRQRPGVEAVSLSAYAEPYSQNYMGNALWNDYDTLRVNVAMRLVTPDHLFVMGYKPADPTVTIDELVEIMRNGGYLISDFGGPDATITSSKKYVNIEGVSAKDIVGRVMHIGRDSLEEVKISGILNPVKRTTIEMGAPLSFFYPIEENSPEILMGQVINIRVSPEADRDFLEKFNADRDRLYTFGNAFIKDIQPYEMVRISADRNNVVEMRKYIACMVFMLVSVFLGLLGTFWFRTQQRVSEIGIRKVNGATNRSIFARLINEGLILLVIVTPIVCIIDYVLTKYELNTFFYNYFSPGRFILTVAATFLLIALMIIVGIWFPAYKAMKVDPAQALADE